MEQCTDLGLGFLEFRVSLLRFELKVGTQEIDVQSDQPKL